MQYKSKHQFSWVMQFSIAILLCLSVWASPRPTPTAASPNDCYSTPCSMNATFGNMRYRLQNWVKNSPTCPDQQANVDRCNSYLKFECKENEIDPNVFITNIEYWQTSTAEVPLSICVERAYANLSDEFDEVDDTAGETDEDDDQELLV